MTTIHPTVLRAPEILRSFALAAAHAGFDDSRFIGAGIDSRVLAQLTLPPEDEIEALDPIPRDGLFELMSRIDDLSLDGDAPAIELAYGRSVPFEVIPFAWQGGDALHYGHLVMAEELGDDDWMVVSFAPSETDVSWLGEDTAQGLANLIATHEKWAEKDASSRVVPRAALAASLGLPVGTALPEGARSDRRATPRVPPGYRLARGATGVGVLAPETAFAAIDPDSVPIEAIDRAAAAALADGHAATALQLLQRQRARSNAKKEREACEQMIAVYEALRRPTMARRVEAHLRLSRFD